MTGEFLKTGNFSNDEISVKFSDYLNQFLVTLDQHFLGNKTDQNRKCQNASHSAQLNCVNFVSRVCL